MKTYWGSHIIILRHIENMESKIFLSNGPFLTFFYPMFANCVHTKTMFVHVSEREIFFSLNCSKFTVQCDWNSKNSQNVQNLGFSEKNLEIFQNRYMWQIFSRTRLKWYFFLKMPFHLIFEVFLATIRKNLKLENMKKQSILKKKRFSSF